MKNAPEEERLAYRKEKIQPLVDEFFDWVKEYTGKVATESTWRAPTYAINQEIYLREFLKSEESCLAFTNVYVCFVLFAFLQTNEIGYVEELSQLLTSTYEDFSEKRKALKSTEARLRELNLLIKNTGQYLGNKDVYKEYIASKDKKKFRESHRTELTLYEATRDYLKEHAPKQETADVKSPFQDTIHQIATAEKEKLTALKNQQYEDFSYVRAKYRELHTVANNVNQMLDHDISIQRNLQQDQHRSSQARQRQEEKSAEQKKTGQSL